MDGCGAVQFDEPDQDTRPPVRSVLDLPDGTPAEKLKALFKQEFEWQLRDNPEFATQAGFHQYDGHLQDLRPQAFEDRLAHIAEVKEALAKLDLGAATDLTETDRLYAELLTEAVDGEARGIELGCHVSPITSIGVGGVVENFLELLEWMRFEDEDDFMTYINRLMAFPKQVENYMDLLAYGACRMKIPASKVMMERVPDILGDILKSNCDELRAPLKGKELPEEITESVDQAIQNCFKHSVARLEDFVKEFYGGRVREAPGIKAVPSGDKIYAECLRFHTTTARTAQEIHDLGLKEVARIEARFKKEVLEAVGFEGTLTEFADSLKADKAHFYDSEDALLDGYRSLTDKIYAELPKYFSKLPAAKLEVVSKRDGPAAYYFAGTADGTRPGRFYVNVESLHESPKYEMAALALHEGVPGHHLQGSLAIENADLPDFIRFIEDRRYEYGPARRPLYTGYLEGWALYCEYLGEEMGMYATPYDLFGRLSMEMMRAVRLVVDTGIHAFDWSVEKASEYMQEKTGMAATSCYKECRRYASWPGQACAYKVGEVAIHDMRSKAEAALGAKFSLPAFHEFLLGNGPMPLTVLEARCDDWVKAQSA